MAKGQFTYVELGVDDAGRRVYQLLLDGETHGRQKALLAFGEYVRQVRAWHRHAPSTAIGVQRWTTPYDRNLTGRFDAPATAAVIAASLTSGATTHCGAGRR